ncbi:MAG: aminotransferase class I/II-fold pyridoxal phosphate-dependent enzyme [Cyclobacteriaceae bacterium]|nr:aminotransferase class I/II-fold pyridoxal phosphate-dependent enzyme [Cyclobacteriaceae bacterium]MCH8515083.1 aminotransferase class I/II-fold pyridoxal phosphate-dependent enzyme [Cyclobacteriaceae bacterium]
MIVDLRSDTFTLPTPEMREAMMKADIGDDVFGEDPSVKLLEDKIAAMFGMEAGLFCPSGTMTNQIALRVHTVPQDEVICEEGAHIYYYEGGGIAYNSLCSVRLVKGKNGIMDVADLANAVRKEDVHFPKSKVLALENTSNRGGGTVYSMDSISKLSAFAQENQLRFHLDGARLFNAIIAQSQDPLVYGRLFDSISICFSKGLGAPVGSALIGTKTFIKEARRVRKVLGGGMRQAGFLAQAATYALDNHINRLADDHRRAKEIATLFGLMEEVKEVKSPETNIILAEVHESVDLSEFLSQWQQKGVKMLAFGPRQFRAVTHLGINDNHIEHLKVMTANRKRKAH